MKERIFTIVVGTSLDKDSDPVVRAAVKVALERGARLYLAHAYDLPVAYLGSPPSGVMITPQDVPIEGLKRELLAAQLARVGGDPDLLGEAIFELGSPHRVILQAAREHAADLILVGPHEGGSRLARWLGSTADRVLRKARVPVWVVRGPSFFWPEKILAPVDLSPLSAESLTRGVEILCQVMPKPWPLIEALFVLSRVDREGSVHFTPEKVERFAMEELERFLKDVPRPQGIELAAQLVTGLPCEEICRATAEQSADLVIVGTHGRSGFERFLLGSVAAEVAREAACGVLVVPPCSASLGDEESELDRGKVKKFLLSELVGPAAGPGKASG